MLPKLFWLLLDSGLLLPNTVGLCLQCETKQVSLCHVNSQRPNSSTYSYVSYILFQCYAVLPFDYWNKVWAGEAMLNMVSSYTFMGNFGYITSFISTFHHFNISVQSSHPNALCCQTSSLVCNHFTSTCLPSSNSLILSFPLPQPLSRAQAATTGRFTPSLVRLGKSSSQTGVMVLSNEIASV